MRSARIVLLACAVAVAVATGSDRFVLFKQPLNTLGWKNVGPALKESTLRFHVAMKYVCSARICTLDDTGVHSTLPKSRDRPCIQIRYCMQLRTTLVQLLRC